MKIPYHTDPRPLAVARLPRPSLTTWSRAPTSPLAHNPLPVSVWNCFVVCLSLLSASSVWVWTLPVMALGAHVQSRHLACVCWEGGVQPPAVLSRSERAAPTTWPQEGAAAPGLCVLSFCLPAPSPRLTSFTPSLVPTWNYRGYPGRGRRNSTVHLWPSSIYPLLWLSFVGSLWKSRKR